MPYPAYEPKSMWSPRSRPIELIKVAESAATGRLSIRTFQTLVAGKTVQLDAPGRVGAPAAVGVGLAVGFGWLVALRGSVPARYSARSVQPSKSVSGRRGLV